MRLLLDTQVIIWIATTDRSLAPRVRSLIEGAGPDRWFSLVSIWEVAIKRGRYGPRFPYEAGPIRAALLDNGYRELPIEARHVLAVEALPPLHGDPFDRLLLAQARIEGLTLLTADRALAAYGPPAMLA